MSVFNQVSDSRLAVIEAILQKIAQGSKPESGKDLAESFTIVELAVISNGMINPNSTPAEVETILDYLEPVFKVYEAIGIPLHLPFNRMNAAQRQAVDKGQEDIKAVGRLLNLWQKANKGEPVTES
ncbi:hypothetical protein ACQ4M3_13475 [Leptolyngbya sp. AN03gr2]|uniref:hypothetical protein n=1 Tax=unclassified Leptolyngbya TaxID=2650499 RepID=UPI003D3123E5